MKYFLISFLLPALALAAVQAPDRSDMGVYQNYATNGGAERGKAGWTVSGAGTLADLVVDPTNKYEGNAGFKWTPNSDAAYLSNTTVTITSTQGLSGQNCAALVYTRTTGALHKIQAYDGTNVLAEKLIPSSTSYQAVSLNFPCPASGTAQIRFDAGDTNVLYFDELRWGDARGVNVGWVSPGGEFVGSIKWVPTTNCLWQQDAGWGPSADADCDDNARTVLGTITDSSSGQKPQFGLNTKPGRYVVKIRGVVLAQGTSGVYVINTRLYSSVVGQIGFTKYHGVNSGSGAAGDTSYEEEFEWSETTSRSLTIDYQCMENTTSATCYFDARYTPFEISVYYYPTSGSSEQAYRPDQVVDRTGEVMAVLRDCPTGTIPANGKVIGLSSGDYQGASYLNLYRYLWALPGITTTAGNPIMISSAKGATADADWSAGKTITVAFHTDSVFLRQYGPTHSGLLGAYQGDQNKTHTHTSIGATFDANSLSASTAGSTYWAPWNNAGGAKNFSTAADGGTETRVRNIAVNFCINWRGTEAVPLLTGSVTSSSAGLERVERASMNGTCTTGTCSLASSTPGISSIAYSSSGVYTVNFAAGTWSAAPTCTCSSNTDANSMCSAMAPSTSAVTLKAYFTTPGYGNTALNVICMGPR